MNTDNWSRRENEAVQPLCRHAIESRQNQNHVNIQSIE